MEKEKIILLGCGQHANVVLYNIKAQGIYDVACILTPETDLIGTEYKGVKVFGTDEDRNKARKKYGTNKFFIGFGNMKFRKKIFDLYVSEGWEPVNIFHPNAIISNDACIGKGVLIEAGCLITPNPVIGDNVVINTGSQVNHDNIIEDHVYIASGVVLSGGVRIKTNTLLDDGVIVTLGRTVPANSIFGAGTVVTKDFEEEGIYYGIPAIKKTQL